MDKQPTTKKPVIFTGFANPLRDLANLNREQNGIQDALSDLVAKEEIRNLWQRNDLDTEAYFDALSDWTNQVAIFHFGGHANSQKLGLHDKTTFFDPLAEELVERNPDSLQLVFLNGCSTKAHVQTLFELGVKAVIATSADVKDSLATDLAIRFYKNLAKGNTIKAAFGSSVRYVKSTQDSLNSHRILAQPETYRGSIFLDEPQSNELPWGLYVQDDDDEALDYAITGHDDVPPKDGTPQGNTGQVIHGNVHNEAKDNGVIVSGNTQGDVNIGRGKK